MTLRPKTTERTASHEDDASQDGNQGGDAARGVDAKARTQTCADADSGADADGNADARDEEARPDADYYVNASAPNGGDGSWDRPFKTITIALAQVAVDQSASPGAARAVAIAAGRYDEALGEKFPLIARGATSLVGASADGTVIDGLGSYDHTGEGGLWQQIRATIIVGDDSANALISGLTIVSNAGFDPDNWGIFCDRGGTIQHPMSDVGLTVLQRLTIGPGFVAGVLAGASTSPMPTGCHLRMLESSSAGNQYAVWGQGCVPGASRRPLPWSSGTTFRRTEICCRWGACTAPWLS